MSEKPINKKIVKHLFTKEEDEMVRCLVNQYGNSNWTNVSRRMKRRTARQCRERWKNYLSPDVKNGPWTKEEDSQLIELVEKNGSQWAKIALLFDNRTDVNVKNRWILLQRSKIKNNQNRNLDDDDNKEEKVEISVNNIKIDKMMRDSPKDESKWNYQDNVEKDEMDMVTMWEEVRWGYSDDQH